MQIKPLTLKQLRHRRFLMALPLITFPFLTLLFWALGGGQLPKSYAQLEIKGLNSTLPEVRRQQESPLSKMEYYDQAQNDARELEEMIRNDPNYQVMAYDEWVDDRLMKGVEWGNEAKDEDVFPSALGISSNQQDNEMRLTQKLAQLENVLLNNETTPEPALGNHFWIDSVEFKGVQSPDVDRLEQMMKAMNGPSEEDPELRQLNGMLEKILDIQHPDRRLDQAVLRADGDQDKAFTIQAVVPSFLVSSLASPAVQENQFFTLEQAALMEEHQNAIQAVVHETQTLVSGSTVKLRLLKAIQVDGVMIPENHFLYGTATLNKERLRVEIKNIRYQQSVFPVQLSLYDLDGGNGIYIPDVLGRQVIKNSSDQTLSSMAWHSLDPSLEAQAASAGVETAKRLFSKQVKLVKVTLKAGYRVLLVNGR